MLRKPPVHRHLARAWPLVLAAAAVFAAGCTSADSRIQLHAEKLASLRSSTQLVLDSWLSGRTRTVYTLTALEQTAALLDDERSELAQAPDALADPRGGRLSQAAERLSRRLAVAIQHVRRGNRDAVRADVNAVPQTMDAP